MDDTQTSTSTPATYLCAVVPYAAAHHVFRALPLEARSHVRLLREGDLVALVRDSSLHDGHGAAREGLASHEIVVERAFQRGEVLPVRFGAVAANDAAIKRHLRDKHDALVHELTRVRGRVEFGLEVFWDRDRIVAEALSNDAELRALRDAVVHEHDVQNYRRHLELAHSVGRVLEKRRSAEAGAIVERLRSRAVDVAMSRLVGPAMVLKAAFLVDRAACDDFDRTLTELAEVHCGRLGFRAFGPIPPYDFVDVAFKKPKPAQRTAELLGI